MEERQEEQSENHEEGFGQKGADNTTKVQQNDGDADELKNKSKARMHRPIQNASRQK